MWINGIFLPNGDVPSRWRVLSHGDALRLEPSELNPPLLDQPSTSVFRNLGRLGWELVAEYPSWALLHAGDTVGFQARYPRPFVTEAIFKRPVKDDLSRPDGHGGS